MTKYKKQKICFTLSPNVVDMLEDLSKMMNVPKSLIVEKSIEYIYNNNLEGEIFKVSKERLDGEKASKEKDKRISSTLKL